MKRIIAMLSLALVALTGVVVTAQSPATDPSTEAQRHVDAFTIGLSLSADQQGRTKTIFTNAAQAQFSLHNQMHAAHQSLAAAIQKNDTAGIDQLSASIGSLTAQLASSESKAQAAFYQILTPAQQSIFNQKHSHAALHSTPDTIKTTTAIPSSTASSPR